MLLALSIRDFVLIRSLDLTVETGFTALTGETGAGKSILLDALGVALGRKAEKRFVRTGAKQACVTAVFDSDAAARCAPLLEDAGFDLIGGEPLTLRRVIPTGGSGRAFLNDQPVSGTLLASLSGLLVEIHGQHDGSALMTPSRHRELLDRYAGSGPLLEQLAGAHTHLRATVADLTELEAARADREVRMDALDGIIEDLSTLAPEEGELERLQGARTFLHDAQKLGESLSTARALLADSDAETILAQAQKAVDKAMRGPALADGGDERNVGQLLQSAGGALERALIETTDATALLDQAFAACAAEPDELERVEDRYFALVGASRRHGRPADELAGYLAACEAERLRLESADTSIAAARKAVGDAEAAYDALAGQLTALRREAGDQLAERVEAELPDLKLERGRFRVHLTSLEDGDRPQAGRDTIRFEVSMNPGTPFGPVDKLASGGELSRLALALKVALADGQEAITLIFDEIDQGVGGAVAAAIGDRLARLSAARQVFAVTHSPQVASSARQHWRIEKNDSPDGVTTSIATLSAAEREEEVARMLSGAEITGEARAAATRLLAAS